MSIYVSAVTACTVVVYIKSVSSIQNVRVEKHLKDNCAQVVWRLRDWRRGFVSHRNPVGMPIGTALWHQVWMWRTMASVTKKHNI